MHARFQAALALYAWVFACGVVLAETAVDEMGVDDHAGVYVEAGAGVERYDSPVLVIDEGVSINIRTDREHFSSPYYQVAGGVYGAVPLGNGREWSNNLDVESRWLPNIPVLDENRIDLQSGIRWPLDAGHARLRMLAGQLVYDSDVLRRNSVGMAMDARIKPQRHEARSIKLEWRRYVHDADNDVLDADRYGLMLGYSRGIPDRWAPLLVLRAGLNTENNRQGADDLSFLQTSMEAELTFSPHPQWEGTVAFEARTTRYREPEPGLDFRRRDANLILALGIGYDLNDTQRIDCEIEYDRLDSNDDLYTGDSQVSGCSISVDY